MELQLNTKLTGLEAVLGIEEGKEDTLGFREICDPFAGAPNYTYAPENCPKNAIPVGDLSNVSDHRCKIALHLNIVRRIMLVAQLLLSLINSVSG